jgi:RNA polymerase sigma-70 factor, ECF subfamily
VTRGFDAALTRARTAWPKLSVDERRFTERLVACAGGDGPDLDERIAQLDIEDLYFTQACAEGNADALAELDRQYFAGLRGPLAKMGLDAPAIDETLQMMRAELLAPHEGSARIANYGGRGSLPGWLRSVAARTGLRLLKKTKRHDELDDNVHADVGGDLELEYMKKTYGEAFQRAFHTAFDAQKPEDRLLLKQRFRHQLGVVELGALHGVNAGTISRWVAAARERLVAATRTEMMRALGIDRDELSSILRMIESQLEISLSTIGV